MSIYAKTKIEAMPGSCTECKFGERYGLVGDVKCKILGDYFTGNVRPPYKERPDACPLVEFPKQANAPLTSEQLKEMAGKPYWHVGLRSNSPPPHWVILEPNVAKNAEDYGYGELWLAYR